MDNIPVQDTVTDMKLIYTVLVMNIKLNIMLY